MICCLILCSLFVSTLQISSDVISALAAINAKGYPDSLIYETVSKTLQRSVTPRSKAELAEALTSPAVESELRRAAMNYAKSKLEPAQQRQLTEAEPLIGRDGSTPSDCSYSWWSWVPWANCPDEKNNDAPDAADAQPVYAKCFK
ncbi:uncharacterized protein [Bemisia tabaci]|uniref:uncharacterized protein n=1 Tax=Bemisia tabaci TaxID=7038 RepID=UPI003B27ECA7